ncbi:MAG: hypothetical protein N2504_04310 [candidate division WOR-3 bacterium]|nr:hypothetical protein [candidate division WOR-3 bacterium]MCX7947792.1 hypothetical protein [candidate division WOR-3 bacterium]MDW8150749.1 hypothetical protein [candidate division WOR-3 bacterium]
MKLKKPIEGIEVLSTKNHHEHYWWCSHGVFPKGVVEIDYEFKVDKKLKESSKLTKMEGVFFRSLEI